MIHEGSQLTHHAGRIVNVRRVFRLVVFEVIAHRLLLVLWYWEVVAESTAAVDDLLASAFWVSNFCARIDLCGPNRGDVRATGWETGVEDFPVIRLRS